MLQKRQYGTKYVNTKRVCKLFEFPQFIFSFPVFALTIFLIIIIFILVNFSDLALLNDFGAPGHITGGV